MSKEDSNLKKKNKKVSIREFVSEDELKFQLYYMKYSKMLKELLTLPFEEYKLIFNKRIQKRLKSLEREVNKAKEEGDEVVEKIAMENIKYVKSTPFLTTPEDIKDKFKTYKNNYINHLEKMFIETNKTKYKTEIENIRKLELSDQPSKTRFGEIILLMIENIATMPSFGGYTDNWKTDFYSNAIEKILLYAYNFDEDLLSRRTGKKSKAFAYITQITTNAFRNILNERKAEENFLQDSISTESANTEGVRSIGTQTSLESTYQDEEKLYITHYDGNEDYEKYVLSIIKYIDMSNNILANNKFIESEIEFYKKTTPENKKDKYYDLFIKEQENQIRNIIENKHIDTIIINTDIEVHSTHKILEKLNESNLELIVKYKEDRVEDKKTTKNTDYFMEWLDD